MTQFHEGQDVEVCEPTVKHPGTARNLRWRGAKIIALLMRITDLDDGSRLIDTFPDYEVQFPDNSLAVFDEEHIRVVEPLCGMSIGQSGEIGADP